MSSPTSTSSSGGLGPSLRRDVAGLSHRLSVLKAGLADLATSGCARAAASEACGKEVRNTEEYLAEVKQVTFVAKQLFFFLKIFRLLMASCYQICPVYLDSCSVCFHILTSCRR